MSQSAISDALARLEAELGVALFLRIGREVQLADAGRDLLPLARRALAALDTAEQSVRRGPGSTSIATPAGAGLHPLAGLVADFARVRPGAVVRLIPVEGGAAVIGAVLSGVAELGLVPRVPVPPELVSSVVGTHELGLAVPADSALGRGGAVVRFEDLDGEPFITGRPGTSVETALERVRSAGAHPRVVVEGAPLQLLPSLVGGGVGVAFLSTAMAPQVRAAGGRLVPLDPPVRFPVRLVHRREALSPASREFFEVAARSLQP